MSRYLKPEHPSHKTNQAWFVFAVVNPKGSGFCRLLLVEAKNHAAVSFIERVADDGRVSPTCCLMTIHRDCDSVGLRSKLSEEVQLRDFALDMVERGRLDRDPLAMEALREAMGPSKAPMAPIPIRDERKYEDALAALSGLGFKQAQAMLMLKPIEANLAHMQMDQILKACLKSAA